MAHAHLSGFWLGWMVGLLVCRFAAAGGIGAESAGGPEGGGRPGTNLLSEVDQQLRAYLKLQEQLHSAQLAIEQARQEFSAASQASSDALAARLQDLERSVSREREEQSQALREASRNQMLLAASIVGVGLLALALVAMFQSRGMNRLSDIASRFSDERWSASGALPALVGADERVLVDAGRGLGVNQTLLHTIQRLEHRIKELEHTAQPELPLNDARSYGGQGRYSLPGSNGTEPPPVDHVSVLLGKGQVLLSLGQAEEALSCYDQALAVAPQYAEAHIKKGLALERLKRTEEAIGCYDRAIALSPGLTQAYLCKGAAYNHLERYGDALACYERALRSDAQA